MGLFGALFAGVSGLDSQSNKIGIISNNISNANTVAYKQGQADFDTLVVPSGSTSFSPGGVIGGNQQLVNEQGIISATSSPTDIAISGNGLIVVNTKADGTGQTLYTRDGSFTQDSNGNFINSDGYYLQALPISSSGATAQANFENLTTAVVNQSATGSATATTMVTAAANLNSAQSVLRGPGELTSISSSDTTNAENTGSEIIVPTALNGLVPGDKLLITSTSNSGTIPVQTFTYGGFTYGRNITATLDTSAASTGTGTTDSAEGLGGNLLDTETGVNITTNLTNPTQVSVPVSAIADYTAGDYGSISGVTTTIGGLTPAELNGEWKIVSATATGGGAGNVVFQLASTSTATSAATGAAAGTVSNRTYPFTGNILNATSDSGDFMAGATISNFATNALGFTIETNGNTSTFTYNADPNTSEGQFNSLDTLATAISNTAGLTATVKNHQLYVSGTDASQNVVLANVDAAGTNGLPGINWLQELGLPSSISGSANTFNSLSGLAAAITSADPTNLTASVTNPSSQTPQLSIYEANPLNEITLSDATTNTGSSLVAELGLSGSNGGPLTQVPSAGTNILTTGQLPATYDPTDPTRNMSSGAITPQYSKDITVYDSQGSSHTLALNFAKLNTNTWAMEVTAVPASDVSPASSDGQVAYGTLTFNGDGGLLQATGSIAATDGFPVNWTNGSGQGNITLNLGLGTSNGIIQTAGAFNFSAANQNGSPVGELTGVTVDTNGYVIASFSNGQTQKDFQIPLAAVNNPDGLEAVSGNAYIQTIASGIANLQFAGTSGVGTFTPSALEQSNVDLSTQLTNLIVAQQAYGANSKVLTVADALLQQLDQIIQ